MREIMIPIVIGALGKDTPIVEPCQSTIKTEEYERDNDTNCHWSTWNKI